MAESPTSGAVVMDIGGHMFKAGLSSDEIPRSIFPTVVGLPRSLDEEMKEPVVGHAALGRRRSVKLTFPLSNRTVSSWENTEMIVRHAFEDELRIDSSEHPVLLSERPKSGRRTREKLVEMMIGSFGVPRYFGSSQAALALYASGRTSGMVLDCGHGGSYCVPIHDGYSQEHCITSSDVGGDGITDCLMTMLNSRPNGQTFQTTREKDIVRDIKEKLAFIATDLETTKSNTRIYELPDGQVINLGAERFRCAEALFYPQRFRTKFEGPGIHELCVQAFTKCPEELKASFRENIVLCGGSTMFPGFDRRLAKEFMNEIHESVTIVAPPNRKYSVWIGGSILASLSTFDSMWVTKAEFEEHGATIVHKKCVLG